MSDLGGNAVPDLGLGCPHLFGVQTEDLNAAHFTFFQNMR